MGLHLAAWAARLGMDVAAACDRDPASRAAARERLSGAVLTESWRDLLDQDLDGVVLANDSDAHAPPALAFLDRGVHVLSEAVACADEAEARALVAAADRSSATYSPAGNRALHPHVLLVREAVRAGELGRISLIEADYLHGMSHEGVTGLTGDPARWRGCGESAPGRCACATRGGPAPTATPARRNASRLRCCWTASPWCARPWRPPWSGPRRWPGAYPVPVPLL
ncbi:Gfo/Idh/MocA family protein [Nocardiopsis sp. RV163]|uniref:Gfo/Idh/MocA family protein n=1 Tax=Nocardiopsis sp. RV163 TaxID=1661388 RepID=UPI000AF209A0|nr:Gfo/Idh/MocA family oxidoreductase [Nocardiopsis sp. RV163]